MKVKYIAALLVISMIASIQSCSSSSDKLQSSIQKNTSAHEQVADKIHGEHNV